MSNRKQEISGFYDYQQNNPNGEFIHDDDLSGVCALMIIEADSDNDADQIAQEHGVYFNGVKSGQDCQCCGDRWQSACWYGPIEFLDCPGDTQLEKIKSYVKEEFDISLNPKKVVRIVYKNGEIVEFNVNE